LRLPRRVLLVAAAAIVLIGLAVGVVTSLGSGSQPLTTVHLADPGGGPARGTATIRAASAGFTIAMRVTGLATSPAGSHYTCWLVGPGDTLTHQNRVSVGSFIVPSDRSAEVRWTTSANLAQFPSLGVTLEPNNGNPLHQGPKVLAATTSLSTNPRGSG
jgi:anti-sigma-K factor RskA